MDIFIWYIHNSSHENTVYSCCLLSEVYIPTTPKPPFLFVSYTYTFKGVATYVLSEYSVAHFYFFPLEANVAAIIL